MMLGGITVIAAGGLIYWGLRGGSHYKEAADRYEQASSTISRLERMKPYPKSENLNARQKAVEDYGKSIEALQKEFNAYRPGKLENVASAEFADRLIKVVAKTKAAFEESGMEIPEGFALGAKKYTSSPANKDATGLLNYQLGALGEMFEAMAAARIDKLTNFVREELPEEKGGEYKAPEGEIARPLSMELSVYGTEPAIRQFIDSLVGSQKHYFVIRSMRVVNEKQTAPTAEDAKFQETAPDAAGDPFGGGFAFPTEDDGADMGVEPSGEEDAGKPAATDKPATDKPAADKPAPGAGAEPPAGEEPAAAEPAAAEPEGDEGERILKQLVGDEKLNVFLRIDLMLFHDKTKLP
jgi:hypothetical protein